MDKKVGGCFQSDERASETLLMSNLAFNITLPSGFEMFRIVSQDVYFTFDENTFWRS